MNHEPDVAREGRNVLMDSDEVAVPIPEKAGQAGYTCPGPHGDQVLAYVVQFAGYGAVAGDAEQPQLLRHIGEALIEGNELPPFRRGQMGIGPMRIEAEVHLPDLPRYDARFIRPHESDGNVGFATAQRDLLSLSGKRKPDVRMVGPEVRQVFSEKMRDQDGRRAERDPANEWSMGGLGQPGDAMGAGLHLQGLREHLPTDRGEGARSWQAIDKPHVQRGLERGKPPADRRVVHFQAAGGAGKRTALRHGQKMPDIFPIDHLCKNAGNTRVYTEFPR